MNMSAHNGAVTRKSIFGLSHSLAAYALFGIRKLISAWQTNCELTVKSGNAILKFQSNDSGGQRVADGKAGWYAPQSGSGQNSDIFRKGQDEQYERKN